MPELVETVLATALSALLIACTADANLEPPPAGPPSPASGPSADPAPGADPASASEQLSHPSADPASATAQLGHPSGDPDRVARLPLAPGALRASLHAGAYLVFRVTMAGMKPYLLRTEFVHADENGCTMRESETDLNGTPLREPASATVTWADLERHARFPKDRTTITADTVDTQIGRLDTLRYDVITRPASGSGETARPADVTRMWFCPTLPGPPIKFEERVDGVVTRRMLLIESHRP